MKRIRINNRISITITPPSDWRRSIMIMKRIPGLTSVVELAYHEYAFIHHNSNRIKLTPSGLWVYVSDSMQIRVLSHGTEIVEVEIRENREFPGPSILSLTEEEFDRLLELDKEISEVLNG